MAHKPAMKVRNKSSPLAAKLQGKIDTVKQQIKQRLKALFPESTPTQPGAVDDDAIKRLRERQKKLEGQLKEAGK